MNTTEAELDVTTSTPVEVRRHGGLAALIGIAAAAVAIAWLSRAASSGAVVDWLVGGALALVAVAWLAAFVDARIPLLVADEHGVRIRLGRAWQGLPWAALDEVRHLPRSAWWRDGALALVPIDDEQVLSGADSSVRRRARLNRRLHGASFAVPLGVATRTVGSGGELTATLRRMAQGATSVIEQTSAPAEDRNAGAAESVEGAESIEAAERVAEAADRREPDALQMIDGVHDSYERPGDATEPLAVAPAADVLAERDDDMLAGEWADDDVAARDDDEQVGAGGGLLLRTRRRLAGLLGGRREHEGEDAAGIGSDADDELIAPVEPVRPLVQARRSESHHQVDTEEELPTGRELRRPGRVSLVEERVDVLAEAPVAALDDTQEEEPRPEPVIGPVLVRARERIGLTVDSLAERTRIRPHVIEAIEVDDFAPCGGDFYARGHLRTLGRVLGLEPGPLVKLYDERYADAPVNARKVLEAELATGTGGIRAVRGGPNWSVVVAAVMAVVLAWSVAKLAMDDRPEPDGIMSLSQGSGGPHGSEQTQRVTVKVTATSASHVEVRNGKGRVVFADDLQAGNIHRIDVVPPVQVRASDGGAVEVEIDNVPQGTVGKAGEKSRKKFAG